MYTFKIHFSGLIAIARDLRAAPKMYVSLLDGTRPNRATGNRRTFTHVPCLKFKVANLVRSQLSQLDYVTLNNDKNPVDGFVMLNKEAISLDYQTDETSLTINQNDVANVLNMYDIHRDRSGRGINLKSSLYGADFPINDALARMIIDKGTIAQGELTDDLFNFPNRPPSGIANDPYNGGMKFARELVLTTDVKSGPVNLILKYYEKDGKTVTSTSTYTFIPVTPNIPVEIFIINMPPGQIAGSDLPLTIYDDWKEDHDFELVYAAADGTIADADKRVPKKHSLGTPLIPVQPSNSIGCVPPLVCGLARFNDIT